MSDVTAIPAKTALCGKLFPAAFADLASLVDTVSDNDVNTADILESIRQEALRGSGSSYEFYSMKFSRAVDRKITQMSSNAGLALMTLAQKTGDYVSLQDEIDLQSGCCDHGIDWGFCPAGCDVPDDEDDFTIDDNEELNRLLMLEI